MPDTSARPLGGRSLHYSEQMGNRFFPSAGDWAVYVEREATLSPDLGEINERSLRYIRIIGRDAALDLRRDHAVWLRDMLTKAIDASLDTAGV